MRKFDKALVSTQLGYFSARQAERMGLSRAVLSYRSNAGSLERVCRGVYRVGSAAPPAVGYILESYLRLDRANPTVSHRSALEMLGLADPIGPPVHLTVDRRHRSLGRQPQIALHTVTRPWSRHDRIKRLGLWVSEPIRSVLDSVSSGLQDDDLDISLERASRLGLIRGPDLGLRALGLRSEHLTRQVWNSMPPSLLNESIARLLGLIAKDWRVGAILLYPTSGSTERHSTWRLVLLVNPELPPYVRDEMRDFFNYELEWPMSNPPAVDVTIVEIDEWDDSRLRTGKRLA